MKRTVNFKNFVFFTLLISLIPLCMGFSENVQEGDVDCSLSSQEISYAYPLDVYESVSLDDVAEYGICNENILMYSHALSKSINIHSGSYVAILSNERDNYSLIYYKGVALDIPTECITFFYKGYRPNYSDSRWVGIDG